MSRHLIVVSIPKSLGDEALEDELSKPYEDGFHLLCLMDSADGKLRAVYKRTAGYVDPAQYAAKEAEAQAIIGAHPNLSLPQAVGLLAARGIKRNTSWVSAERSRASFSKQSSNE